MSLVFGVCGLGFRVPARVPGSGLRLLAQGLQSRVWGSGFLAKLLGGFAGALKVVDGFAAFG